MTQSFGGVQTFIFGILNEVDHNSFDFAVACQESDFSKKLETMKVKWFPVSFVREPSMIKDIAAFLQLVKIIRKYNPDIVHSHSAKAGFIGRLAAFITRTKVIYTPNAFSFLGFAGYKRYLFLFLERFARHFTTLLHTVSASEGVLAVAMLKYRPEKIILIPNSIEISPGEAHRIDYKAKKYCVGMIGRLTYQKNPEMFIRVASEVQKYIPDIKFILLGEGYLDFLKERVFQIIEKQNASGFVQIYQWGTEVNSENFFKKIDIFLLTSRFEGLPFALLEAMSRGIPSVVTNVDGNRDVITHNQDGYLVTIDDFQMMAKYVIQLINDDDLRQKIGLAGMKKVRQNFNLSNNSKNYRNMYNNLQYR